MTMPKFFTPTFIGNLIKMEAGHEKGTPIFERLCCAVQQCRNYNAGDQAYREQLWPFMLRTRKELRDLGVMVG